MQRDIQVQGRMLAAQGRRKGAMRATALKRKIDQS
jgi:hypothetical protein